MRLSVMVCSVLLLAASCGGSRPPVAVGPDPDLASTPPVAVAYIKTPVRVAVPLGQAEGRPAPVKAYDSDGALIPDAPIALSSSNDAIGILDGTHLVAHSMSSATITAQVGSHQATVEAFAIVQQESEPMLIEDGERRILEFQPGRHLVMIGTKPASGGRSGLKVSWVGADCAGSPERQGILVACDLGEPASLVLDNPLGEARAGAQMVSVVRMVPAIPSEQARQWLIESFREGAD